MADLDASVMNEARELCAQLLDGRTDQDAYWLTTRVHGLFTPYLTESVTACDLYMITAFLTDRWELRPDERVAAAREMREAASELMAVGDDEKLDTYLARWKERLGVDEPSRSDRSSRLRGWLRGHS